jgi:signal transduction histidine kinase
VDQDVTEVDAPPAAAPNGRVPDRDSRFTIDPGPGDDPGQDASTGEPAPRSALGRLRLGQWVTIIVAVLGIVLVASVIVGGTALNRQSDARTEIIDVLDPARTSSLELQASIVAQQNSLRGFALNALETNLDAYDAARQTQASVTKTLNRLVADTPGLEPRIAAVGSAMESWREEFATPAIERIRREGPRPSDPDRAARSGESFANVTAGLTALRQDIADRRAEARQLLSDSTRSMTISFYAIAGVLALTLVAVAIAMRQAITKPLERLAAHARIVARGDLEHRLAGEGPADVVGLADDVDSMRLRILADLEEVRRSRMRLEEQARELQLKARDLERSNAELEQFAYVASHDLQEPLRKVASFCQLLQRRYEGQLDERADQYIGFAVDGAKRMQNLITDLLAFSRVGRMETEFIDVPLDETVKTALANLTSRVEDTGARLEVGPLPVVPGEPVLLTAVFQNLIGNALKFHGEEPPAVHVRAERTGDMWTITCTDEGIGIDAEYSERIFAIFQRLHPKETYEGTGIGLALCRKIVEHHGGTIWLDKQGESGATFRFTLPARAERTG